MLGTGDLVSYLSKFNIELTPDVERILKKYAMRGGQRRAWLSFVSKGCPVPSTDGIDLLDKLLVYDHEARFSAQQAIQHPFFDPVRDRVRGEVRGQAINGNNRTFAALR